MKNQFAPILLITYNRPEKTLAVLNSLLICNELKFSRLYVSIDGPKEGRLTDSFSQDLIEKTVINFKSNVHCLEINRRSDNLGLADNIVDSLNWVLTKEERVIILEDDIEIATPYFLKFMNEALEKYNNTNIFQISAYNYPVITRDFQQDIFALRVLSCWGWATWRDKWAHYNHDVNNHYRYWSSSSKLRKEFDIRGGAHFFGQLKRNHKGEMYSWAVRWYASWMKAGGKSIFPRQSLVKNTGMDGTGTFTENTQRYDTAIDYSETWNWHVSHAENNLMEESIDLFFRERGNIKSKLTLKSLVLLPLKYIKNHSKKLIESVVNELLKRNTIHRSTINQPSRIGRGVQLNDVVLGSYSYISQNSIVSHTIIGKFCSIGPNCMIGWGIHPLKGISTSPMFYSTRKQNGISLSSTNKIEERKLINIGNDVFIGMNVVILDGITIGDGAVIGAGAVVSKNIPPYAIAVGSPIKIIGYRFDSPTIEKLLAIRWWDKSDDTLKQIENYFFQVDNFIDNQFNS